MATNKLIWEESTEIVIDSEVEEASTGWTLDYISVVRAGAAVLVHLEATSDGTGTGVVCLLPTEFCPSDEVTSADGAFTIGTDGTVTRVAGGGAGTARLNVNYAAGSPSP